MNRKNIFVLVPFVLSMSFLVSCNKCKEYIVKFNTDGGSLIADKS